MGNKNKLYSNSRINKTKEDDYTNNLNKQKFCSNIKSFIKKNLSVVCTTLVMSSISSNAFSSGAANQIVPRLVTSSALTPPALLSTGKGLDRGNIPENAVKLGYFIIPNGATFNTVPDGGSITFRNINGYWFPFYNSIPLRGIGINDTTTNVAYFSDTTLNIDNFNHIKVLSNNGTVLSWEDLYAGGDLTFNDVLLRISLQRTDTNSAIAFGSNGVHVIDESGKYTLSLDSLNTNRIVSFGNSIGHYFADVNNNILSGAVLDFNNVKNNVGKPTTVINYTGINAFIAGETLQYSQAATVISDINNNNIVASDVSLLLPNTSPKLQLNNSASLGSVKNTPGRTDNLLAVTLAPNVTLNLTGTGGTFYDNSTVGANNYSGLGTIDGTSSGSGSLSINNPAANVSLTKKIGGINPINSLSVLAGTLSTTNDINISGNVTIDRADTNNIGSLVFNGNNNTLNLNAAAVLFTGGVNQIGGNITVNGAQIFNLNVGQATSSSTLKGIINLNAVSNSLTFNSPFDIGNSGNGALQGLNVNTNNQNIIINPNVYFRGITYTGTGLATFNSTVNLKSNLIVSPVRPGNFTVNGTGTVVFNQGLSSVAADGVTSNLVYVADGTVRIPANKKLNTNAYATGTANIGTLIFEGGDSQWNGVASGPNGSLPIKTLLAGAGNLSLLGGIYNIGETQGTGTDIIFIPTKTTINGNFNLTGGAKVNLSIGAVNAGNTAGPVTLNGTVGTRVFPIGNIQLTSPSTILNLNKNVYANQLEFQGASSIANLYGMLNSNVLFTSGGTVNISSNNAGVSGDINGNNGKITVSSNLTNVNFNGNIGNNTPINSMNIGASSLVNLNSDARFNNPNGAAITLGQNAVLTFIGDRNITGVSGTEYIKGAANNNGSLVFLDGDTNINNLSLGINGNKLNSIIVLNNSILKTDSNINVEKLQIGDANAPATLLIKPTTTVSEVIDSLTLANENSTYQIDSTNAAGGLEFNQNTNAGVAYDAIGTIIINANNHPITINGTGAFGNSNAQRVKKIILMGNSQITLNIDTHAVEIVDATLGNVIFNGAYNHTGTKVNPEAILTIDSANRIDINANREYSIVDYKGYGATIRLAEGVTLTAPLVDSTNTNSGIVECVGNCNLVGSDHPIPSGIGLLKAGAAGTNTTISRYETIKDVQGLSNTGSITFAANTVLDGSINLNGGAASTINFSGGGAVRSIGEGAAVGNINLNGPGTVNFWFKVIGKSLNINDQGAVAKIYDNLLTPVNFAAPGTLEIALSNINVANSIDGGGNIIVDPNLQNIVFAKDIGSVIPVNSLKIGAGSTVFIGGSVTTNGAATTLGNGSRFIVNNNNANINTIINAQNPGNGRVVVNENITGVVFNKPIGLDVAVDRIFIWNNAEATINSDVKVNSIMLSDNATLNFGQNGIYIDAPIDGYGSVKIKDSTTNVYFAKAIGSNAAVKEFTIGQQASAIIRDNLTIDKQSGLGINLGNNSNLYINGANILVDGKIDGAGSIIIGSAPVEADFVNSSNVVFDQVIGSTSKPLSLTLSDDSTAQFNKSAGFVNDINLGNNSTGLFADNVKAQNINGTNGSSIVKFINVNPITVEANVGTSLVKNIIVTNNDVTITGNANTKAINFSNAQVPTTLSVLGNMTLSDGGVTSAGDLTHTLAIKGNFDTGTAPIGAPDHRLKSVKQLADGTITINSTNFYSGITTANNNQGKALFNVDGAFAFNIGALGASLNEVKFAGNGIAKGDLYSNSIVVNDGKIAAFSGNGAIVSANAISLGNNGQLLFTGNDINVTGKINGSVNPTGVITINGANTIFNSQIGNNVVLNSFVLNSNSSATLNEEIYLSGTGIKLNQNTVLTLSGNSTVKAANGAAIDFVGVNGKLNITRNTNVRIDAPIKVNNSGTITANNLGSGTGLLINGPIGSINDNKSLSLLQATGGGNIRLAGGDANIDNIDIGNNDSRLTLSGPNGNYKFKLSHQNNKGRLIIDNSARLKQGTNISTADNPLYEVSFSGNNRLIVEGVDIYTKQGINTTASGQGILEFAGSSTVGAVVGRNNPLNNILISGSNNTVTFPEKINLTGKLIIKPTNIIKISKDTVATSIESTEANQAIVEFTNSSPITVKASVGANNPLNKVIMSNRSVSVTGNFGSNEIDFTNANQISALKILGNTDLTNVNVTTNSIRRNHNVHISNDQIIRGKWGDKDHLMGGIRALKDLRIVIDTPYYFGGINASENNTVTVEFREGSSAYTVGRQDGNAIKQLVAVGNTFVGGVTNAQSMRIDDGKTIIFGSGFLIEDRDDQLDTIRPHPISQNGITLGLGSKAILKDNALLEAEIIAKQSGSGDVYFQGRAEVKGVMGTAQNKLNTINFTGINNRDPVRLVKSMAANNINFDNVSANIAYTIRLNGNVNAKNTDFILNSKILTLPNTVATLSGDIKIATTFDGVEGGHITAEGNKAVLDFSGANSMEITVNADTQLASNEEKSYVLFLRTQGGKVIQNNPGNIQVISNDKNRFVNWTYNPADRKLIARLNSSAARNEISSNPRANSDDINLVNYLVENANEPRVAAALNTLGASNNSEEALDVTKQLQPDVQNAAGSVVEDLASVSTVVDNRLDRIRINKENTLAYQGSGVAAGDEQEVNYGLWFGPFYDRSTQRVRGTKSGYKASSYGATIGYDTKINDLVVIGGGISYVDTNVKHQHSKVGDKTKINSAVLSLYGMKEFLNDWFIQGNGYASYSFAKNSEKRGQAQAKSKYHINSYGLQALAGYDYRITRSFVATPKIGARYDRFGQISYTENGADAMNLKIKKKADNRLEGIVGCELTLEKQVKEILITPEIHGFVNYNFLKKAASLKVNLVDVAAPLPITTAKQSRVTYNLGGSIEASRGIFELGVVYDALIQPKYLSHQGTLRVKVSL